MQTNHTAPNDPNDLCETTKQATIWARQAGQIAMHHFQSNISPERKADNTLLTRADLEIERFLVNQIRIAYPNHNILSEETTSNRRRTASPYTWVIDPLDGTTAFIHGLPGWGISVGLLHHEQPVMGLFYMPLLDDLTYTCSGQAFDFCEGQPLATPPEQCPASPQPCPFPRVIGQTVRPDWDNNGFLAVSAGAHKDFEIDIPRIRALGSVGASLVYTARGSATAALIPKAFLWDLAAGALILERAGGALSYLSGRPVDYGQLLDGRLNAEPIIAGHPEMLAELRRAIRVAGV